MSVRATRVVTVPRATTTRTVSRVHVLPAIVEPRVQQVRRKWYTCTLYIISFFKWFRVGHGYGYVMVTGMSWLRVGHGYG